MNGHDFTREQNMEARIRLAAARRELADAVNDATTGIGCLTCDDPQTMNHIRACWKRIYDRYLETDSLIADLAACARNITDGGEWKPSELATESKRMLDRFLNMSYGKHPLLIIRIVDSDSDVLRIPRGYEHAAEVVNLRPHPEIEMLVIINEGMYGKYTNGSKRLKPSDYCKRELGMKQVKSRAWLERYWAASGFREPASCGAPADCQHGAHLVEDASLVLLRCLHVLIPESQGDLSLRRHADPVFHKTSQTGPVPFALIPDEAPLCTTRSKNVRHVAHAVKSRVRTIMLDRRVYRVAMQAKGGR